MSSGRMTVGDSEAVVSVAAPVVREMDAHRPKRWVVPRMLAMTIRRSLDRKIRFVLLLVARVAALCIVAWEVGAVAAVIVLCAMLVASHAPSARKLLRGRVWEVSLGDTSKVCAWAVLNPHPLDHDTWQLDIVQHPSQGRNADWAPALLHAVHRAADTHGVAVQSVDDADTPLLLHFGYLWTATPFSAKPFLLRPFPGTESADPEETRPLSAAYEHLVKHPDDATALRQLTTRILSDAASIQDSMEEFWWQPYVVRRTAPAWLLARACALCLDSHIEGLARDRIAAANRTGETEQEAHQIDEIITCLLRTTKKLRYAIQRSTEVAMQDGWPTSTWAESLATLELDALALAGLTATARRRSGAALGVLDTASSNSVQAAAHLVQDGANRARRSFWFDSEDVSAWASAVAHDALELCRVRFASFGLRPAIKRLAEQSLRQLTFLSLPLSPLPAQKGEQDGVEAYWEAYLPAQKGEHHDVEAYWEAYLQHSKAREHPPSRLAPLSATRLQRIGVVRGADGPRAQHFRRTLTEIITTFLIILVIGTLAWVLTVTALHPGLLYEEVVDYFTLTIYGEEWIPGAGNSRGGWDLGVESELLKDSTIGLLAVVVTATVAVAVAKPRESSIKAWSQDRAWQIFVVAVGYIASIAALVLAISPLPLWFSLSLDEKAHTVSAIMFALLSAAAAASLSVVQSRLDEFQQRRRLLLAQARLQRAHARLGPSPHPLRLVLDGLRCVLLATVHLLAFDVFALITSGEDWSLLAFLEFITIVAVLNLPPMIALTIVCVARWLSVWNLAGRVAITAGVLAAFALILMAVPISIYIAYGSDSVLQIITIAVFVMSPSLVFLIFLVAARRASFKPQRRTGPGTFALHIALRIGRRTFQRAS